MLLFGDNFSVIPLTTHINIKDVHYLIKNKKLKSILDFLLKIIKEKKYRLNFKFIKFLKKFFHFRIRFRPTEKVGNFKLS